MHKPLISSDARGIWTGCPFVFKNLESLQFGQIRIISRLLVIGQDEGNMMILTYMNMITRCKCDFVYLYVTFKCDFVDQKK